MSDLYGQECQTFVRYVASRYLARPSDIERAINLEYEELLSATDLRKTVANKKRIFEDALANCRAWLSYDRMFIKPEHLVMYRRSALFFLSIKKLV